MKKKTTEPKPTSNLNTKTTREAPRPATWRSLERLVGETFPAPRVPKGRKRRSPPWQIAERVARLGARIASRLPASGDVLGVSGLRLDIDDMRLLLDALEKEASL